MQKVIEAGTKK
jgi:hypothetical protein